MSSEALERAQEISVVLDDVCGAAVASDTRVHLARAALDTLLAEVARLEQERDEWQASYRLQAKMTNDAGDAALAAEAALAVAREREQRAQRLREAAEVVVAEWRAENPFVGYSVEALAAALDEPAAAISKQAVDDYRQDLAKLAESQTVASVGQPPASAAADEPGETP